MRQPPRLWLLLAAACLVPAVLDAFQTYMQGQVTGRGEPSWRVILWQGSEWLILGALTPLTYYLGRRFPLRRPRLARSVIAHVLGALALCVAWAASGVALRFLLGTNPEQLSTGRYLASWMLTSLPWSVFMYFAVLGCVHAFSYFFEARERESQAARLAAQLAEARLGALRMQLHPHFLFNSLNAVGVLVRDQRAAEATRMIELLSDVLREVLASDKAHEVALADELRFVRQYLAIEQVRFSDRLAVAYDIDESLTGAAVPAFILQPLVENALRHGFAKRSDSGKLEITARRDGADLVLVVGDDGPGPGDESTVRYREGVGLANIRERLTTMYRVRASLSLERAPAGGTIATVRLPFRILIASAAPNSPPATFVHA